MLENIPSDSLPRHGGVATTLMVVVDHERLVSGVGVANTSTGDPMTVGQARRLACRAGILPVVLGGEHRGSHGHLAPPRPRRPPAPSGIIGRASRPADRLGLQR